MMADCRKPTAPIAGVPDFGLVVNNEPCCQALSPDGKTITIGTVYFYESPAVA